ncbi:hypothetical protein L6R46_12750 [Myxococcota bacterium]|nr:hypothetical protein [Myxococcota bacterium]
MSDRRALRTAHEAEAALARLSFLLGEWRSEGRLHEAPVTGICTARRALTGAFIEVHEQVYSSSGDLEYEDLCVYAYNEQFHELEVHQFTAPSSHAAFLALALESGPGVRWAPRTTLGPLVRLQPHPSGDGFTEEVWHAESPTADVYLRFLPR